MFNAALSKPVRLQTRRDRPHFLGMGSILDRANSASTVLGSGFLAPPVAGSLNPEKCVAVRGELSLAGIAQTEGVLLGDPMVLLSLVIPFRTQPDGPVGFVPHISEVSHARRLKIPGVKIIDPSDAPWRVIQDIASCSRIFSQSLHGLIVADTLDVPNIWIEPGKKMAGYRFKFYDYFSTTDALKEPYPFDLETFIDTPIHLFEISRYMYDKKIYLDAIREAVFKKQDRNVN